MRNLFLLFAILQIGILSLPLFASNTGQPLPSESELCLAYESYTEGLGFDTVYDSYCVSSEVDRVRRITAVFIFPLLWNIGKAEEDLSAAMTKNGLVENSEISLSHSYRKCQDCDERSVKVFTNPKYKDSDYCFVSKLSRSGNFSEDNVVHSASLVCTKSGAFEVLGITNIKDINTVMEKQNYQIVPKPKDHYNQNWEVYRKNTAVGS